MARVQSYERVVDAVFIHRSPALDLKIENGVKIKEEPIDTTLNNATEDHTLVTNCYSLIDHDYHYRDNKSSLSNNDTLYEDINNSENMHKSNDSALSNDVNKTKTVNVKHTQPKTALLQLKKQKCSNEVSNKNTNVLRTTTENVSRKRKQQNVILDCKTKIQRTNKSAKKKITECDICFRKFTSVRNFEAHKQYYSFSDTTCRFCRKLFATHQKLLYHIRCKHSIKHHKRVHDFKCNFCNRTFKNKAWLQSHLFHVHSELIYSKNTIKGETSKSGNATPEDTLRISANEESCSNNINKSWDENIMDNEKPRIEKSFNIQMSPIKRLRQPTLTEYLELCKKKRDIKVNPNKLNIVKDNFPVYTSHHEQREGSSKPKLLKGHNQIKSLPTKSDNLPKQVEHSILEQTNVKHEMCLPKSLPKKSCVRLHTDVKMMTSFLEELSDTTVKDKLTEDQTSDNFLYDHEVPYKLRSHKLTEDQTSDNILYDREIPYKLRSLREVSYMEVNSDLDIRKNKNVSKKFQVNIECNNKREQEIIDIDKVDWKISKAYFKFKECTIPLTRCDEQPRNSCQISTNNAMENTSLTTQCNSIFQESEVRNRNKMILKDVEITLERLTTVPSTNIKIKTELDVEKHNIFLCNICKKSFSSKLAKREHIKSSHIAYMSSICRARYTLKHKLVKHYLNEHQFEQNQCCICYMLFSDYKVLKQHLSVHCLKYIQRESDQCLINIELKCNVTEKTPLITSSKTLSSQSSLEAQSCCVVQEEMEKDRKDSMEEANTHPKDIPEIQHKNIDENLVTCDKRINSDDLSKPLNSNDIEKRSNELQISLHSEKEIKINETNRKSLVNNYLIEEKIERINESQKSKKLLENNNSTNNPNTANTQLDDITTRSMTYPCDICGKQFINPKNLEIHLRTFSLTTDICPMCGTGFSSKRFLQTHITAAHVPHISKTYNFHCVFCNQGFFKKYDLRPHILHLHGQQVLNMLTRNLNVNQERSDHPSIMNYHTAICNVCNLVFETHDGYVEHRMYYYKNHIFTCKICAQNFQGMYMFHHHNKLIHYSEDKRKSYNYICDICNEGFNHESHFYSHNMHVHSNERNLVETAKEFGERNRSDHSSGIQEKIRNVSTDQQKQNEHSMSSSEYICEICQLKCIDMGTMARHIEFYSNDGDFSCDKCNRRCKTFDLLDQHKKLTHLYHDVHNRHLCHICGEILETVIALKCHEKHFHPNTIDNTDNWKNCVQTSSSNITYKTMEHPDESKNNTCNVTEYNCLFCDMKFPTANTIQTHIVYVHMDDMIAKRTVLKLTLPIINNDDIRKRFVDPALSSSLSSSSLSSSISSLSSSEDNSVLQRSTIQHSSNIIHNILNNTTAKNTITDETTVDLLKKLRTIHPQNNKIIKKVPLPTISLQKLTLINKSKNISIFAPNMKSKADTSVSSSTGSTIVASSNEFGNNTSVLLSNCLISGPTISKTIVSNTESKDYTLVPISGLINDLRKSDHKESLKSRSINELKVNSASSSNRSIIINRSKTEPVPPLSTGSSSTKGSKFKLIIPQSWKSNEITNQKSESVNSYDYSCPLCPLQYPSLMFFHAHLKYAHADSIRTNLSQMFQDQRNIMINCLLCSYSFSDEIKYKKHLRNSHTRYFRIANSEEITKFNNMHNPLITQTYKNKTNINRKSSTIPEIITVDDDDDNDVDNVKNTSDQQATEITAILDHKTQNEKIGKLKVRPLAKIIENLSTNSAMNLL